MTNIFSIRFDQSNWVIDVDISIWFLPFILICWLLIHFILQWFRNRTSSAYQFEAQIGFGSNIVTINPNYEDLQVAYRLWTELSTRKIGLLIDEEHDVITEIYSSWYSFFEYVIARGLIKEIPVTQFRNSEATEKIVDLAMTILNDEIRPHLTRWQAQYQKQEMIASQESENSNLTSQEIQQKFSHYDELMTDLRQVTQSLSSYTQSLGKLVRQG